MTGVRNGGGGVFFSSTYRLHVEKIQKVLKPFSKTKPRIDKSFYIKLQLILLVLILDINQNLFETYKAYFFAIHLSFIFA